jgi:hypothetical protein
MTGKRVMIQDNYTKTVPVQKTINRVRKNPLQPEVGSSIFVTAYYADIPAFII